MGLALVTGSGHGLDCWQKSCGTLQVRSCWRDGFTLDLAAARMAPVLLEELPIVFLLVAKR